MAEQAKETMKLVQKQQGNSSCICQKYQQLLLYITRYRELANKLEVFCSGNLPMKMV
jgi:hypothetical protein